jgi:hypothetical protein
MIRYDDEHEQFKGTYMGDVDCEFCGDQFRTVPSARIVILRAASGYLVMTRVEQVLHACESLTPHDRSQLLRDAATLLDDTGSAQ